MRNLTSNSHFCFKGQSVSISHYSIGPTYDPYLLVDTKVNGCTLVESGLSDCVEIKYKDGSVLKLPIEPRLDMEWLDRVTEANWGFSYTDFMESQYDEPPICECGSDNIDEKPGYPGESLGVCNDCGKVCYSFCNMSEIV